MERGMEMKYNQHEVPLLPQKHDISRLYAKYVQKQGHCVISATTSKVKQRSLIAGLHRIAKSIKCNLVL